MLGFSSFVSQSPGVSLPQVHCTQYTFVLALSPAEPQHFRERDYRGNDYKSTNLKFHIYQNKVANSVGLY